MTTPRIPIPTHAIADFCRRWKITELALFGSVLRDDFHPNSDVDIMVVFEPGTVWDFDEWDMMVQELERMFGRRVDLVQRKLIQNPFIRYHALTNRQVLYAA